MAVASLLGQAIGFVVLAIVARRLGAENIGYWYLTVSIVAFFYLPAGLGMTTLGTREAATDPPIARRVAGEVVVAQGVLAILMFVGLFLTSDLIAGSNPLLRTLLLIGGVALLANALSLEWVLLALGRPGWVASWRLLGQITYGVLGVLLITSGAEGTRTYAALNMLGLAVTAIGTWITVVLLIGRPACRLRPRRLIGRVRRSLPFGALLAMVQVYWALGTVLLGILGTARAVGLYGVAQRVPQVIITLVLLWISAMYPHAAALFKTDPDRLVRQIRTALGASVSLFTPVVLIAPFIGTDLMSALFGAEYADAGAPFAALVLLAFVTSVSTTLTGVLMAAGGERRVLRYVAVGACAAVVLNIMLIPILGPVAPALGTAAAEGLVAMFCARRLALYLGPLFPSIGSHRRLALASIACLAFLVLANGLPWQPRALIAASIYAALSGIVGMRGWVPRICLPRPE